MKTACLFLLCGLALGVSPANAQTDAAGCADSPLIGRFPGSVISQCRDQADDQVTLENIGPKKESKLFEGELHQTDYRCPASSAKAQVVANLHSVFPLEPVKSP